MLVVANFATTEADGKINQADYYNLDVIITIGYRVKYLWGVKFRIWASNVLKESNLNKQVPEVVVKG